MAAHGELVAGLSTRNSGSLHKARRARREPPMRLHLPFLDAETLAVPCGETRAARDCVTETSSNMTSSDHWLSDHTTPISNSTAVERDSDSQFSSKKFNLSSKLFWIFNVGKRKSTRT